MKLNEIDQIANKFNSNVEVEEPKGFIDFYHLVKEGKLVPVTNENDVIIGFNTVADKPTTLKVCKMINGHMTVGDTEEERNQDEKKLQKFLLEYQGENLQKWFEYSLLLSKSDINVDDVIFSPDENGDDTIYIIDATSKKIYNQEGDTVIDLSNDPDLMTTSKSVTIKLLTAAFNAQY